MAQWRKIVVSGSTAELNNISASGNIVPVTTDGSSLGTSTHNFSDLFLDSGAVVNFDSSDVTLTHAANEVQVDGGDLVVEGTNKVGFGGAPSTDYIQKSTDVKVVAAADIILDPAGGQVSPASNDDAGLGEAGKAWSDLFLAEGAVINWDSNDITLTQTADQLALAGGYLTVAGSITGSHFSGSADSTGSFGYLNVSGDAVIAGNLTFGDADTDTVSFGADITSNILPDASDSYNLGSTSKRWNDLYLSGSISASGGPHHIISATTIDIDSEGALTLDGGSITIGGDADVVVDIDSAALDIDASGAITIDGTSTVSIDGADDMNFTITSNAGSEDLTIAQVGANDSSIIITAAGTGTDAISIDATAGDMVIAPTLINGKTLTIGPSSATQMVFTPHGTAANEKISLTNTAGDATDAIAVTATAGGVDINAGTVLALDGTGGIDIGKTADAAIDIDSVAFDLDASGAITIDSTSTIGIGINDIDQAINIGTQGERTITVGNVAGATGLALNAGTGGVALASTGAGDITLTSTDTVLVDSAGVLELNSSAGAIGVGNDAVGQKISVGGDIVTRTEVELNAILVDVNAGTGGVTIDAGAASNFTTTAGDITLDAVAASVNIDGGENATNAVRIVASHTDGGIDVDAGTNGINVDSTGAISIGGTNATTVTLGRVGQTINMPGNVDVNGTVFTIDATNIMISESFATFCSGSNIERDGGFMVESSSLSTGKGFGWDASIGRWGVDHDLAYDAFEIGAESSQGAYFALVLDGTTYSHTTGSEYAKPGNIWIDGDDDVWIYT